MTRKVRDAILDTRNVRRSLKQRSEPYWRALDRGLHLGYRRRANGGSWIVRWYNPSGRYLKHRLGIADDFGDADGLKTLDYRQAQAAAREWALKEIRKEQGLDPAEDGPYTVEGAIRDYLARYSSQGQGLAVTKSSANAHILPNLGSIEISRLTTKKIADWHHQLGKSPALLRTAKAATERNFRKMNNDPETLRRRRATANRVLTILKAALNFAWKEGRIASDTAWRKVKAFRNVDVPVIRYLTEAECKRLVNACPKDFRKMVQAALLTGCRYGELTSLRVADFDSDNGTIIIRMSKSGKPRHVILTEEAQAFFDTITAGKKGTDIVFAHEDGRPWGESHQSRPLIDACTAAKITPAISFHVLRHTHGSMLAMKGVPMGVIAAQLGHADTRMTEKHYAHLSPSYVADTIRVSFPKLGLSSNGIVKKFKGKKTV